MASFRCYDNSDVKPYDKFSSISNKTMVAIFPNVCLWRRSYAQNWEVLTLKNCYSIEPPSYASTAYVVASFGLVSFPLFRKNLGNLREFFGQIVYRPPWQKIARTPMRLSPCKMPSVEDSTVSIAGYTRAKTPVLVYSLLPFAVHEYQSDYIPFPEV